VPFETDQAPQGVLATGEELLWGGIPRPGFRFRARDVVGSVFSVGVLVVELYIGGHIVAAGAPVSIDLIVVGMWAVGIYFAVGRFFVERRQRAHWWFGVTDRRVILLTEWPRRRVLALDLLAIGDVRLLEERDDGSGSVRFEAAVPQPESPGARGITRRLSSLTFDLIDGARTVYDIAEKARSRAQERPDSWPAMAPADWLADPTRRHQYRYWDGARWTAAVADGGVRSDDPV
jgi:hypothetical protein